MRCWENHLFEKQTAAICESPPPGPEIIRAITPDSRRVLDQPPEPARFDDFSPGMKQCFILETERPVHVFASRR